MVWRYGAKMVKIEVPLKCFGIGFHPIEYEMNTTRRWSPLFGSPNMAKILQ